MYTGMSCNSLKSNRSGFCLLCLARQAWGKQGITVPLETAQIIAEIGHKLVFRTHEAAPL